MAHTLIFLVFLGGAALGSLVTLLAPRFRSIFGQKGTSSVSLGKHLSPPIKLAPSMSRPKISPAAPSAPREEAAQENLDFSSPVGKVGFQGSTRGLVAVLAIILLLVTIGVLALRPNLFEKSAPATPPAPAMPPVTVIIYNEMKKGLVTPRYHVDPLANREVVSGLVGSYYYLDLQDAASQRSLFFGPKEYKKDEISNDFHDAMTSFHKDILSHAEQKHIPYQLFVRGSADITGNSARYLADLAEGEFKLINYLPLVPGNINQYSSQSTTQRVPKQYRNKDLPNLRAAYAQEKLAALGFESRILQGEVTKNADEKDRYVVMLLYVNWPANVTGKARATTPLTH